MKHVITILLFLLSAYNLSAKSNMEESFYSNGKIYVVVAVLIIIFSGLIGFLVHLERKISRLEKAST